MEPSAAQAHPSHAHLWGYLHTLSCAVDAGAIDADVLLVALCSSTQCTCMIVGAWTLQLA